MFEDGCERFKTVYSLKMISPSNVINYNILIRYSFKNCGEKWIIVICERKLCFVVRL